MKKILFIITLVGLFFASGCTPDVDDKFDEDATTRVNKAVAAWHDVLVSASNGWVMEYYPEPDHIYGGCTLILKFEKLSNPHGITTQVTIASQIADASYTETSLYDISREDGPVLNMETYNSLLHYFRDPTVGKFKDNTYGFQGDILFILPELTPEIQNGAEFDVYGLQTKNRIHMRRLEEGTSWASYLGAIQQAQSDIAAAGISNYYAVINGKNFRMQETGDFFRVKYAEDIPDPSLPVDPFDLVTTFESYHITETGIKFYDEIEFNGAKFQELIFDKATNTFTSTTDPVIVFTTKTVSSLSDMQGVWKAEVTGTGPETWNIDIQPEEGTATAFGWAAGFWTGEITNSTIPDSRYIYTYDRKSGQLKLENGYYMNNGARRFIHFGFDEGGNFKQDPLYGSVQDSKLVWNSSGAWTYAGYYVGYIENNTYFITYQSVGRGDYTR